MSVKFKKTNKTKVKGRPSSCLPSHHYCKLTMGLYPLLSRIGILTILSNIIRKTLDSQLVATETYLHTQELVPLYTVIVTNSWKNNIGRPAAFAIPINWNGVLVPGFLANGTFIPFPLPKLQIQIASSLFLSIC